MRTAVVGILIDQQTAEKHRKYGLNVFGNYIKEILSHVGMPYVRIDHTEQITEIKPDILVAALTDEDKNTRQQLLDYVDQGGHLISYAGLNGMASILGCTERQHLSVGYAVLEGEIGTSNWHALRCLKARPWSINPDNAGLRQATGSLRSGIAQGAEAGAVLLQFKYGQGQIDRWSVDILHTIVTMQQGIGPVIDDGVPAPDGSAAVNDNILKADDRIAMDWELDRSFTEKGTPYFAYPYADLWRERLIGHLLKKVTSLGLTLPFLGYWPDGIDYIAHISHDSDHNIDKSAATTLQVLEECGIHSTWCMIEPGYSPEMFDAIKKAGHELALHYNALDIGGGHWDQAEFDRQADWLKQAADMDQIISNKNHYTRFEGWGEFFAWCEAAGIKADQTRGPSKTGNVGFLFGTCHPYFPISLFDENNRFYDVLEIGFLTQDLDNPNVTDSSVLVPFLEQVKQVEGIAHFLFHQVHIDNLPDVADALRKVVKEAKQRGFVFWTSRQINEWERARRQIRIQGLSENGQLNVEGSLSNAVVWVPLPEGEAIAEAGQAALKFGVLCRKYTI
ncbi:hypothetical protein [Paenibacillus sp. IITD108]|uniref:hypothetical protein n=1 Tax=Paenibacillus sp. IITD108 TaxID=3116649 RepID=UPI002F3F83C4